MEGDAVRWYERKKEESQNTWESEEEWGITWWPFFFSDHACQKAPSDRFFFPSQDPRCSVPFYFFSDFPSFPFYAEYSSSWPNRLSLRAQVTQIVFFFNFTFPSFFLLFSAHSFFLFFSFFFTFHFFFFFFFYFFLFIFFSFFIFILFFIIFLLLFFSFFFLSFYFFVFSVFFFYLFSICFLFVFLCTRTELGSHSCSSLLIFYWK